MLLFSEDAVDNPGTSTSTSSTSGLSFGNTSLSLGSLPIGNSSLPVLPIIVAAYAAIGMPKAPRMLKKLQLPILAASLYYSGLPQKLGSTIASKIPGQFGDIISNPYISTIATTLILRSLTKGGGILGRKAYRRGRRYVSGFRRTYRTSRNTGFSRRHSINRAYRYRRWYR